MASVLYSSFGTTDPVRGLRDGGFLHILRFYRPEAVYLFLTKEIVERDRQDHRIDKTFSFIRENWGGYDPQLIRMDTEIGNPSDMDFLTDPMNELLQRVLTEHPKTEILINLSSGTPQMKLIMAQMAQDTRLPTRGIQVMSPENAAGKEARTHISNYSVDDNLNNNLDELPGEESRCREPRLTAVHREAVRNQLLALVSQRNYSAIAQMGADLPAPIPQLARHLDYRSRFLLSDAKKAAVGLTDYKLMPNRGVYTKPVYEMIEYFAMLKHLVYLKRYTDFMLRLNPFVVRLQMLLLDSALKPYGLTAEDLTVKENRQRKFSPEKIRRTLPELLAYMEEKLNGPVDERSMSILAMNLMLDYLGVEKSTRKLLESCEKGNYYLRNPAAHELFAITDKDIQNICRSDSKTLIGNLEKVLMDVLAGYGDRNLKRRINIYDHCDKIIRECL